MGHPDNCQSAGRYAGRDMVEFCMDVEGIRGRGRSPACANARLRDVAGRGGVKLCVGDRSSACVNAMLWDVAGRSGVKLGVGDRSSAYVDARLLCVGDRSQCTNSVLR